MTARYELWTRFEPTRTWRVTGPGTNFHGAGRRGYLTLPPLEICDSDGAVIAVLGGNRRVAPNRHELSAPGLGLLAVFETPRIASAIGRRPTRVVGSNGEERCTLTPAAAVARGGADFAASVLSDDSHLVRREGVTIGRLGLPRVGRRLLWQRATRLAAEMRELLDGEGSERQTGLLTLDAPLDPALCAALLLYDRYVIAPARTPES